MRHLLTTTLAVALLCGVAHASTSVNPSKISCGNKGPFYGRTDGMCFDAGMYGPLFVNNGAAFSAPPSSTMVSIFEDFLGNFTIPDVDSADGQQSTWGRQDAGSQATCGTAVSSAVDGQMEMLIDNGSEVGDCSVYFGDQKSISSDKEPVCIYRIKVEALPAAADKLFWGFTSARNALLESATYLAGFTVAGASLVLKAESDDNSTDVAPTSTGVTLTADTFYEFKVSTNGIDGASATNVKLFYQSSLGGDWTALLPTTTFSIGAAQAIQPMLQVEKTTGTTTPGMKVDYVSCYWKRS